MYILAEKCNFHIFIEKISDYSKYLNLYFTPLLKPVDALKCEELCYLDEVGDTCSVSSTCVAPHFFFPQLSNEILTRIPLFLNPATNRVCITQM